MTAGLGLKEIIDEVLQFLLIGTYNCVFHWGAVGWGRVRLTYRPNGWPK
jgi:hypothetical protein